VRGFIFAKKKVAITLCFTKAGGAHAAVIKKNAAHFLSSRPGRGGHVDMTPSRHRERGRRD